MMFFSSSRCDLWRKKLENIIISSLHMAAAFGLIATAHLRAAAKQLNKF